MQYVSGNPVGSWFRLYELLTQASALYYLHHQTLIPDTVYDLLCKLVLERYAVACRHCPEFRSKVGVSSLRTGWIDPALADPKVTAQLKLLTDQP